jgi:hypothetical protein
MLLAVVHDLGIVNGGLHSTTIYHATSTCDIVIINPRVLSTRIISRNVSDP